MANDPRKLILFISNGYGEDRSGGMIARELGDLLESKGETGIELLGASLVGSGREYTSRGIDLIFSAKPPPSGGFTTHSVKAFFSDLFSDSLGTLRNFKKTLEKYADRTVLAVACGDVPLVWMTRRGLKKQPLMFIDLPKSEYITPHFGIELRFLKQNADRIFNRDEYTARRFRKLGLAAEFVGNPLMDGLNPADIGLILDPDKPTVGLLPGSREEAYQNFALILDVVELIGKVFPAQFIAALPDSLTDEKIVSHVSNRGWNLDSGPTARVPFPQLKKDQLEVVLTRGVFGGALHASDVVIGLAGTANEQAAGLGKPVVAFRGTGPQTTSRRFKEQSRLLGKALKFVEGKPEDVAAEVIYLMNNEAEREDRGTEGREHMGGTGGSRRLAEIIYENFIQPVDNFEP